MRSVTKKRGKNVLFMKFYLSSLESEICNLKEKPIINVTHTNWSNIGQNREEYDESNVNTLIYKKR